MFKYSYNSLVYYGEDVFKSIDRVARFGYDAIELVGEDNYDCPKVKAACSDAGIKVSSICSIFVGSERDLNNSDSENRKKSVAYTKSVVDLASEVDASVVILGPGSACSKTIAQADRAQELEWAADSIRQVAEYAAPLGIKLCIEAWNRYETYFVNTLAQAMELRQKVDMDNVGVMGDTFHMNIDEYDMAEAVRACGKHLFHMHLADSNRTAPGAGHLDLYPVLKALMDIGYEGYLSYELLPAAADPFAVLKAGGADDFYDKYTEMAIKNTKKIEELVVKGCR